MCIRDSSEDILNIFCFFANRRMFFRSLYLTLNIGVRVLLTSLLYLIVPGAGIGFSIWLLSTAPFAGAIFAGSLALTFSAVSYTHLDVYKRQVLYPACTCCQ